jgi:hypothetical protein
MLTAKTIDKEAKDSFVKLFKTEILLFFLNETPVNVVSEIVYIIGSNIKNGMIRDACLYFSPKSKTKTSFPKRRLIPKKNISTVMT